MPDPDPADFTSIGKNRNFARYLKFYVLNFTVAYPNDIPGTYLDAAGLIFWNTIKYFTLSGIFIFRNPNYYNYDSQLSFLVLWIATGVSSVIFIKSIVCCRNTILISIMNDEKVVPETSNDSFLQMMNVAIKSTHLAPLLLLISEIIYIIIYHDIPTVAFVAKNIVWISIIMVFVVCMVSETIIIILVSLISNLKSITLVIILSVTFYHIFLVRLDNVYELFSVTSISFVGGPSLLYFVMYSFRGYKNLYASISKSTNTPMSADTILSLSCIFVFLIYIVIVFCYLTVIGIDGINRSLLIPFDLAHNYLGKYSVILLVSVIGSAITEILVSLTEGDG
ncbi:hypothetical protein RF11_12910 [Thelohanellus kitauei]|uniref:Uncharacterized protein n=1 Tax=Thelohanellus kitauei TaxID=669202 RepID=A0A0C2MAY0_THEKT|nr:hypothetical protein RF11_12910 [Thelohanellus kitauei]